MEDLPSFLTSLSVNGPDKPILAGETPTTSASKGKAFTARDHEVVQNILKLTKHLHQLTDIEVSNHTLGKAMGMTNGAVSSRIKRLSELGIIQVVHFNATDTGENNRRVIHVVKQPPAPFKPWEPRQ